MKCPLLLPLVIVLLPLAFFSASAQIFENNEGSKEVLFLTKVIQLDEFVHRFNNDSASNIQRYYLAHNRPFNKERTALIRSLFNGSQHWDSVLTEAFIRQVTDPSHPGRLSFFDDGWYAEADCRFLYRTSAVSVRLMLKFKVNTNHSAQWIILSARSPASLGPDSIFSPERITPRKWIQPAANNTYFAELERDFSDRQNLSSFFDSSFFGRRQSYGFYQALSRGQLKFGSVKAIRYHFLQIPDWVFTVENFERETRNAGWLISSIHHLPEEQRPEYEKNLLEE